MFVLGKEGNICVIRDASASYPMTLAYPGNYGCEFWGNKEGVKRGGRVENEQKKGGKRRGTKREDVSKRVAQKRIYCNEVYERNTHPESERETCDT